MSCNPALPRISVITAVFNNRAFVSDAITSVLAQEYKNVEYIVVDGASTDGTIGIIESYLDRVATFVTEPDQGIYDALNKGIALATGDIIGFLHSDDFFPSNDCLTKVAAALVSPEVDIAYGDLQYVRKDRTNQIVRYWRPGKFVQAKLSKGWMPPHPTFYCRRHVYLNHGGFDCHYKIAADYDCMIRLLSRTQSNPVYIPEVLVKMRLGGASNKNIQNLVNKSAEDLDVIKKHSLGGLMTLLWKNVSKLPQFFNRS